MKTKTKNIILISFTIIIAIIYTCIINNIGYNKGYTDGGISMYNEMDSVFYFIPKSDFQEQKPKQEPKHFQDIFVNN